MKPLNYRSVAGAILFVVMADALAQPVITRQPTNQSVSLGASVKFQVAATTTSPPIRYQWRFAAAELAGQTNSTLNLTNIQVINAGSYGAVLTDGSGSITSRLALLEVDAAFTKITTGGIVTDIGTAIGCAWGDYDGDGFFDLLVMNQYDPVTGLAQKNQLFRNDRNGGFTKITNTLLTDEARDWRTCAWADYDNDGDLDAFLSSSDGFGYSSQRQLFKNNGDGTFERVSAASAGNSEGAVWADFDRDGFADLFVARYGLDWLFKNDGDGLSELPISLGGPREDSYGAVWGDVNNDGWPDLFVPVKSDPSTNRLYLNDGRGWFQNVVTGSVVSDIGHSFGCGWADYDNDGSLDLFVMNGGYIGNERIFVYQNDGSGSLSRMTNQLGELASDTGSFVACALGDYDNDGYVDLFVTKLGGPNQLYHNEGNGAFTRIRSGSLANDENRTPVNCTWADYDNDGFLDLFVARGANFAPEKNLLYRNAGNSNGWIKLRLIGTVSNRSAIGAKIRIETATRGRQLRQMREINTGNGLAGSPLEAHFGVGDAAEIQRIRIEWPSGNVQEFSGILPKQIFRIFEPSRLSFSQTNGNRQLSLKGARGLTYQIQSSSDLATWFPLANVTITNRIGVAPVTYSQEEVKRFYRAAQADP